MTNSLDGLIKEILRREKNSNELIQQFSNSLTTNDESLVVVYEDANGVESEIQIPSYGYLLSRLNVVESNMDAISGVSYRNVSLVGSDGIRRSLTKSNLPYPKNPSNALTTSNEFNIKNQKPFTSSRYPQTYFNINLPYLDDVNEYLIRSYKLLLNDSNDILYFDENIRGRNDINISEIDQLSTNNISFELLEYREFIDVLNINSNNRFSVESFRKTNDGTYYKLNTIQYIDNGGSTKLLSSGDSLVIDYNNEKTTCYEITNIIPETNEVSLKLIEGFDPIRIGSNIFGLYQKINESKLPIEIANNEYMIIFIKPIIKNFGIVPNEWGEGISISSDMFSLNNQNLNDFDNSNVIDYQNGISNSLKNTFIPPTDINDKPAPPNLSIDSLSINIVNRHKQGTQNDELRKKNNEKIRLKEQISELSVEIESLKTRISTTEYDTTEELDKDRRNLQDKQNRLSAIESDYSSLIDEINATIQDIDNFSPKYRIEGFIPLPEYKYEVIGMKIQYRYLTNDGNSIQSNEYKYTDDQDNTQKANKSKWISFNTPIKTRQIDSNNNVIWVIDNQESADELNINEISIPITQNEQVEIRVKTIGEVGYPTPIESDWSDSLNVPFDESILSETPNITNSTLIESIKNELNTELTNRGVYDHVSESTKVLGKTYYHFANNIGTSEIKDNRPKTLEEKIVEMEGIISELKSLVTSSIPEMSVKIIDENDNVLATVSNNSEISIFGGYYVDEIETLQVKKGQIISKIYYIEISNLTDTSDLELLSYVPGVNEKLPIVDLPSIDYDGYLINKDEYRLYRKYWQTPASYRNTANNDILISKYNNAVDPYINISAFQSSQTKGQFIYARNRDITLGDSLYITPNDQKDDFYMPTFDNNGNGNRPYVWNGDSLGSGNGNITDFCVHIDHPELQSGSDFLQNYNDLFSSYTFNSNGLLVRGIPSVILNNSRFFYPVFSQSKYFELDDTKENYYKQLNYRQIEKLPSGSPTELNFPRKIGFGNDDTYLIGKNTCGSYLFMAPQDEKQITIGSATYNSTKVIKNGDSFKIRIPIIFQSRFTDYDGSGNSGNGNLGGIVNNTNNNLVYTKKMGFDINVRNDDIFSFDISVTMKYKRDSLDSIRL